MKRIRIDAIIFVLLITCGAHVARAQKPSSGQSASGGTPERERFAASDLVFQQQFATRRSGGSAVYCLMGRGFFVAPTSSDFSSAISAWLAKHPDARAETVFTIGPISGTSPTPLVYVWIVDGDENLAVSLVREGHIPGGALLLRASDRALVTEAEYATFERDVRKAEDEARRERLRIWKDSTPETPR